MHHRTFNSVLFKHWLKEHSDALPPAPREGAEQIHLHNFRKPTFAVHTSRA